MRAVARCVGFWSCVMASVVTAQEPSAAVLGNDDAAFARELGEAGYTDLAAGLCTAIEHAPAMEAAELAAARALRLDLMLWEARREKDPGARRVALTKVLEEKLAILGHGEATPAADAVRDSLPDVYQALGEALVAEMERATSPDQVNRLREEGVTLLRTAEETTRARIAVLAQGPDDVETPEGRRLLSARYALPRICFFRSRLYPEGSPLRDELLHTALDLFQEIGLDYGDTLVNYEAMIYAGLCLRDLGQGDAALAQFDSALELSQRYAHRGPHGGVLLPSDALDIVAGAAIQKVALLRERKQPRAMVAAVDDYEAHIDNAWSVPRALLLLGGLGDGLLALGDADGVREAARRLRRAGAAAGDRWAEWKARDLEAALVRSGLAGSEAGDPAAWLRAAGVLHAQKDDDRALALCRAVVHMVRGSDRSATLGAEAWMLVGVIHASRGMLHEASVAYDALAEECPGAALAPEGLWRAASCYLELHAREHRRFYAQRMQARIDALVARYPDSEPARKAALLRARQLEEEEDFDAAYQHYLKVPAGAPGHEEAQYRAGTCLVREVRRLFAAQRPNEARARAQLAELQLRTAQELLGRAAGATLDLGEVASLEAMAFGARVWLANLFLTEGVDRPQDVATLFADAETALRAHPERMAAAFALRIQALVALQRLDEAWTLYQSTRLVLKTPGGLQPAARMLARAFDQRAVARRAGGAGAEGDPDPMWRRAATLYKDGVEAGVGESVAVAELEDAGTRLLVIGLHFARVPESRDTFIGWSGAAGAGDGFLADAATVLAAAVERSPSSLLLIKLAQTQAWRGHWVECAATYARLFDGEPLAPPGGGRLDGALLQARPELLMAYLEWAAAERVVARQTRDRARFARCLQILDNVLLSFASTTRVWWLARCEQIGALLDHGSYETADTAYQSVLRTQEPATIARFGCSEAFAEFGRILKEKVLR